MNCKSDNSLMPLRTYFEADENWGQGSAPKFDSSNLTSELGESELWGAKNVDAKLLGTFGIVREPTLFFFCASTQHESNRQVRILSTTSKSDSCPRDVADHHSLRILRSQDPQNEPCPKKSDPSL